MSNLLECSVNVSIIQVDEARIRGHVDEVVRNSVEATLNGMLEPGQAPKRIVAGQLTDESAQLAIFPRSAT